jgi:hypothetical protein
MSKEVLAVAMDKKQATKSRIAAIYTVKQLLGEKSHTQLLELAKDPAVAEHALRALADRKTQLKGVPVKVFTDALKNQKPRGAGSCCRGAWENRRSKSSQ